MGAAFHVGEVALAIWAGHALVLVAENEVQRRMTPPEVIGMPASEVIVGEVHAPFLAALRRARNTLRPVTYESEHFRVTIDPVRLRDGSLGVVSAARLVAPMSELPDADALRPLLLRPAP